MEVLKSAYPRLNSKLFPVFLDSHTLQIPSNKTFNYTAPINKPDSYYLNGGCTTVVRNTGLGVDGTNFNERAVFIENPEVFKNGGGGKHTSDMSQSEIENIIDGFIDSRGGGYKIVTAGWNEAYEGLIEWRLDPSINPNQCKWAQQRMVTRLAPLGGRFYNTYDGVVNVMAATDNLANCESLRAPLSDMNAAFNFAQGNTGFGNQFFPGNGYQYMHGIINTYWAGYTNSFRRILKAMFELIIARNALISKGSGARLMPFAFLGGSEFTNYLQRYDIDVTGGHIESYSFPQYADSVQAILGYISFLLGEDPYCWQDTGRRGMNPDFRPKSTNALTFVGSGGQDIDAVHQYTTGNAPYVEARYGGHDAFMVGSDMFSKSSRWASQNFTIAPTRKVGESNWKTSGATSLVDRQQDSGIIAFVHRYNNRRAVFAFDLAGNPDTMNEHEIDLDGGVLAIRLNGGGFAHRLVNL